MKKSKVSQQYGNKRLEKDGKDGCFRTRQNKVNIQLRENKNIKQGIPYKIRIRETADKARAGQGLRLGVARQGKARQGKARRVKEVGKVKERKVK